MKKLKLFSLALMALFTTSAWANETYYLQTPGAATPALTGDFYTTASLEQDVTCSYDEISYSEAVKFGGNATWPAGSSGYSYPNRMIRYDCKTTETEFIIVAYANANSKTLSVGDIKQAALGSANTVSSATSVPLDNGSITTKTYSIKSSTRASLYVSTPNSSNVFIVQIIATEKGTAHPTPGNVGYIANFNKTRAVVRSGNETTLDHSLTLSVNENQEAGNKTYVKMQTKGTHYIKFHTGAVPNKLRVNVSSSSTYYVGKTSSATTNEATASQIVKLDANQDYYINPNGSNVQVTGIEFLAAPKVTYNANGGGSSMDPSYFTVAANGFTAPAGQEFKEWNTLSTGLGDSYEEGDEIESDITLYAIWVVAAPKFDITFNNGGHGTAPSAINDSKVTLEELNAEGYLHQGWKANQDVTVDEAVVSANTLIANGKTAFVSANTLFTAQWTELFAITEGTPANGSVDADLAEAEAGTTVTLTATPAFRYLFGAWDVYKTGDESTKVTVTNNKFTMPEYAVTVSATFTADARKQILYLKSSTSTSNDKMYSALNSVEDYNVIIEVPASQNVTNYDLVVLHESLSGNLAKSDGNAMIRGLKTADVPVLNTKSYFYNSDRWDWGTPNAGTSVTGATLNSAYCNTASHPIFEGVTISEGFVTLFSEAKAKAMQPVEPKSGKEGFTLATTSNDGKGTGTTCIQELTPAQRGIEGVSTSKYLLISIGNENGCFNLLTADGQKLLKNAAAYLLSDETWTPKTLEVTIADGIEHGSVDVDIDCAAEGDEITLSNEPVDGYQFVAYDVYNTSDAETKVIVTDGKFTMPAYAVTVSATFAELFAITCSPAENGSVTADKAKAIAGETVTLTVNPAKDYVATNVSYNGTTITPVNDVYSFTMPAQAVTVTATFAKSASGVDNTEVGAKAVKTLKNGVLIIEKNGVRYNMLGERVQ